MISEAAFTAAVERYQRRLVAFAYRKLGNWADAEDVVQEALLDVWAARADFRGEVALRRWLVYAVLRELLDARRLQAIEARYTAAYMNGASVRPDGGEELGLPQPASPAPEDRDVVLDVEAALHDIPEPERSVLWAMFGEGASVTEAAQQAGVGRSFLSQRLRRHVLPKLRERLAAYKGG